MNEDSSDSMSQLLKFFGFKKHKKHPLQRLLSLLDESQQEKIINDDTAEMAKALLTLNQKQVRDIMIPRGQMIVFQEEDNMHDVLKVILSSGHSRYPVLAEENKSVRGILLSKDLLALLVNKHLDEQYFLSILRPPMIVPEGKPLDAMLREFRSSRNHMAVVIDEYGTVSGLVTIEDVIEEIVGEIDDEHDEIPQSDVRVMTDNLYHVNALMTIEDFNHRFNEHFSNEDADTIGGYVLAHLGRMPHAGESFICNGWHFTIARANKRRIIALRMRQCASDEQEESSAS